ncbi:MAG: ammonium transporter [Thermoprotei archaeon]
MLPSSASTAWVLTSSALVMLMIPGLGLFYAGMVKQEDLQAVMEQGVLSLLLVTLEWAVLGFSLSFSPGSPFLGGLSWAGLAGLGAQVQGPGIPMLAFAIFMGMFAAITPALITGVFPTRVKAFTLTFFILLWSLLVYDPVAHWVWGQGGWLRDMGMLDFAGGTVVHLNAGMAALAYAVYARRRKRQPLPVTSVGNGSYLVLGALLLLFGWFGFNSGSALSADGLAALAFVNTVLGAASAGLVWMIWGWKRDSPGVLESMQGLVAGLVVITPAAGFVTPSYAIVLGASGGLLTRLASSFRERRKLADPLDVWGVHGVGGAWGALATGVFATVGAEGLVAGNVVAVLVQAIGVLSVGAYSFVVSYVLIALLDGALGFEARRPEVLTAMQAHVPAPSAGKRQESSSASSAPRPLRDYGSCPRIWHWIPCANHPHCTWMDLATASPACLPSALGDKSLAGRPAHQ